MTQQNETGLISSLEDRFIGCIVGGAIGDGIGTSTEGRTPQAILERFGGRVEGFVPPFAPKADGRYKGDGNVSDDTLMVLALVRAYAKKGGYLNAHDMATHFLPEIVDKPVWIPEYQREMPLVERLFYPEKYLFLRLRLASVNPREGGLGNMVNCGAAMYAAPVGLMNACDPDAAYHNAINMFSAHQFSYGLEAAGVMAACVAEALRPSATVDSIVATAIELAKDGTRGALEAVAAAAKNAPKGDESALQNHLRSAIEPFDTVKGGVQEFERTGAYPSQLHSIEEVPLALGFLICSGGDFSEAVLGAVNYGRDSDSIAGMVGAIIGAMVGKSGLPAKWVKEIGPRNRVDFDAAGRELVGVFERCDADAQARAKVRRDELSSLLRVNGKQA